VQVRGLITDSGDQASDVCDRRWPQNWSRVRCEGWDGLTSGSLPQRLWATTSIRRLQWAAYGAHRG